MRIGNDLVDLSEDVTVPNDMLVQIDWALTGEENKATAVDNRHMGIPGRFVEPLRVEAGYMHWMILSASVRS